jgi:DNA repair protein RadC
MKYIKKLELKATRLKLGESHAPYNAVISSPEDAVGILQSVYQGEDREIFICLVLDVRNKVLGYYEAAKGFIDGCPVDPREVFRIAIHMGASAILMAHNHPSGDPSPSTEDVALTKKLSEGSKILGIPILDHLIVTESGYCSMKEKGEL